MLNTPPPGYSPQTMNAQRIGYLGVPGQQGIPGQPRMPIRPPQGATMPTPFTPQMAMARALAQPVQPR